MYREAYCHRLFSLSIRFALEVTYNFVHYFIFFNLYFCLTKSLELFSIHFYYASLHKNTRTDVHWYYSNVFNVSKPPSFKNWSFLNKRRSFSIISFTKSCKVYFGCQFNFSLHFVASPFNKSTSVGRK